MYRGSCKLSNRHFDRRNILVILPYRFTGCKPGTIQGRLLSRSARSLTRTSTRSAIIILAREHSGIVFCPAFESSIIFCRIQTSQLPARHLAFVFFESDRPHWYWLQTLRLFIRLPVLLKHFARLKLHGFPHRATHKLGWELETHRAASVGLRQTAESNLPIKFSKNTYWNVRVAPPNNSSRPRNQLTHSNLATKKLCILLQL